MPGSSFYKQGGGGFAKHPPEYPHCLLWKRQTNGIGQTGRRRAAAGPGLAVACSMQYGQGFLASAFLEINIIEVAAEDLSALCGDSGEGARGEAVPGAGAAALLCEELGCPVAHEGCCR